MHMSRVGRPAPAHLPRSEARTPAASSEAARNRMRATRQRDTAAERAVRAALWSAGLRGYRLHRAVVPGVRRTADIVFLRPRLAIFVDGCFWHGCPQHGTLAKANGTWWREKIAANKERDRDTDRRLAQDGWRVVRVWEHETPSEAVERIRRALADHRSPYRVNAETRPQGLPLR